MAAVAKHHPLQPRVRLSFTSNAVRMPGSPTAFDPSDSPLQAQADAKKQQQATAAADQAKREAAARAKREAASRGAAPAPAPAAAPAPAPGPTPPSAEEERAAREAAEELQEMERRAALMTEDFASARAKSRRMTQVGARKAAQKPSRGGETSCPLPPYFYSFFFSLSFVVALTLFVVVVAVRGLLW